MMPLTTLYDDYIDRPKLSEHKKNPFGYIVPPPPKWVVTNTLFIPLFTVANSLCFERNSALKLLHKFFRSPNSMFTMHDVKMLL